MSTAWHAPSYLTSPKSGHSQERNNMSEVSSDNNSDSELGQNDQRHQELLSPRSTARRTTRNRVPRLTTAGISDSDFSDVDLSADESPRKNTRKGAHHTKKSSKHMPPFRDESGRPLSPAEARRQRKRITNRESARRMRLLRKEEWNNLQQEVHEKTTELQKVHNINRRMNEGYAALEIKCRNLQQHNHLLINEILSLVEHLRENLGKEIDNRRLAVFLRNMSQLLPPLGEAPHGVSLWPSTDPKSPGLGEGKALRATSNQIHITANGTSASFNTMHMSRAASAPEPPQAHYSDSMRKRMRSGSPNNNGGGLSPSVRPPLHPGSSAAAESGAHRDLLPSLEAIGLDQQMRSPGNELLTSEGDRRMSVPSLGPSGGQEGLLQRGLSAIDLPMLASIKCESDSVLLSNMPEAPMMHSPGPLSGPAMQQSLPPMIPDEDHRPVTAPVIGLDGSTGSGDFVLPSLSRFPSLDEQLRKQMSVDGLEKQISLGRLIGIDLFES